MLLVFLSATVASREILVPLQPTTRQVIIFSSEPTTIQYFHRDQWRRTFSRSRTPWTINIDQPGPGNMLKVIVESDAPLTHQELAYPPLTMQRFLGYMLTTTHAMLLTAGVLGAVRIFG